MDILLALFLALNAFLLGVFVTWAIRHWHRHLRPSTLSSVPPASQIQFPAELRNQLVERAKQRLEESLDNSSHQFGGDLDKTSARLNALLEKFGSDIINDEMNLFQSRLKEIREETATAFHGAQSQVKAHEQELETAINARRVELEAQLNQTMLAEQQRLVSQLDTKLSDAVTSFLLEALGKEVDLGAQTPYLVSLLDAHKDELKKEVGYEGTSPTP